MRKVALIIFLLSFVLVPAVQAAPSCTLSGTNGNDRLQGDASRNVICAKSGQDYANGRGGSDIDRGSTGSDTLVGGDGADVIRGGAGRDEIFAVDKAPGDEVHGGRGRDKCYVDQGDGVSGCEHVVRV